MNQELQRRNLAISCGIGYAVALLVLLWARSLQPVFLGIGAVALVAGVLWQSGGRRFRPVRPVDGRPPLVVYAGVALALAYVTAWAVERRLERFDAEWPELVVEREEDLARELDRSLARLVERSLAVTERAAVRATRSERVDLFEELADLRTRSGVAALAIFDGAGELVAWAGEHRGALPPAVRLGARDVLYAERPLFGYLYFSKPVEGKEERVVAATLLQTGLVLEGQTSSAFADRFAEAFGSRPYFTPGPGPEDAWPVVVNGDTVAHARFDAIPRAELRTGIAKSGRRVVVPLALLAMLVLAAAWLRAFRGQDILTAVPLLAMTVGIGVAPLGAIIAADGLFSPALYLLPLPGEPSLGRLLSLLLPLAALTAVARPRRLEGRTGRVAMAVGMMAVAIGFAGGLRLILAGASPNLLEGGPAYWGAVQVTAFLVLTMIAALALPQGEPGRTHRGALFGGGALLLILAGAVLVRWRLTRSVDPWLASLWALPFAFLARGIMPYAGQASRVIRWLVAGCLAACAVLPHLWVVEVDAKIRAADRELATLGPYPDPFLDFLLNRFAADAMARDVRGEDGVELLYRSWVASGLAREAYPAHIRLWHPDRRRAQDLSVGDAASVRLARRISQRRLLEEIERARDAGAPVVEPAFNTGGGQILAVPLDDGRAVTVVVPPRRSLDRATILAPILGASPRADMKLTLVPVTRVESEDTASTRWIRTDEGWRSEKTLRYPDGAYHAHLELRLPPAGILLARGALVLALDLMLLLLLWVLGRTARGELPSPPGGWIAWFGTFRSRVTLALFAFFLLPTVVFGALAYRALAGEAARTARVMAERSVAQAAEAFTELPGDWPAIADRIGEEVLYYHRGELAQASAPEVVELGLFGAWMPPSVYASLQSGEEVGVVETRTLAGRPYVVAYRRLPAGTVAVPVSYATGEASLRQRELADLILFFVLLGGVLSLLLSVLVGRALARPIGQLRRASYAVGRGRLRVRLPESGAGEFGELFASFNRMVRRLRRARARDMHTTRVLAWGEMSRQVAHEIKNPLTPIKLSVQHLRRAYKDGRTDFGQILDSNVEQILTEIDRLTEIARAFSRYGAPPEAAGPLEPVDVAGAIREALTLYRSGAEKIAYRSEIESGLPPVLARPGEVKEVLLNLLENAHAALDGEGRVTITARSVGEEVELVVSDDGPGIPADLLQRIFEPHFSTRSTGTGLGLAIVRRLVESWGGTLIAESEVGQGTAIRMKLTPAKVPTVASGS